MDLVAALHPTNGTFPFTGGKATQHAESVTSQVSFAQADGTPLRAAADQQPDGGARTVQEGCLQANGAGSGAPRGRGRFP